MSEQSSPPRPVFLPEVLDLRAAVPLTSELRALRGVETEVDGSQVRRLGGQCLQVLLSAHATWEADGACLRFVDLSPEFLEGLSLMGAGELERRAAA